MLFFVIMLGLYKHFGPVMCHTKAFRACSEISIVFSPAPNWFFSYIFFCLHSEIKSLLSEQRTIGEMAGENAASSAICSICYEDLKPVAENLQSISACGHVFHELWLVLHNQ